MAQKDKAIPYVMHLQSEHSGSYRMKAYETRRRDDVQPDGSQAHCWCTLSFLW
jgi:hypothetical protein